MTFNTSAIIWNGVFVAISLIDFIANIMSISYFIKNEKNGLANKLMISLNFTDMLWIFICKTFSILALVFYVNEVESGKELKFDSKLLFVANLTFNSSCIISGCLTFGLTLVRTIVIYNPFYRIKQKLFVRCLVFMAVMLVTLMEALTFWTNMLPDRFKGYSIYALMIAVLSCGNIVMSAATIILLKKTRSDGQQERNHAAVTMVIISVIYFITSFPILVMFLISKNNTVDYLDVYVYTFMFSLSSFLNPLVYIFRKRQMQRFVKEQFHKLLFCCWTKIPLSFRADYINIQKRRTRKQQSSSSALNLGKDRICCNL